MILASLFDSGLSYKKLETLLKKCLGLKDWSFVIKTKESNYHVPVKQLNIKGEKRFNSPQYMKKLIRTSRLPENVKNMSLRVLECLITAESRAHKVPSRNVHFHELNSLDTLIDVVGCCFALDLLKIDKIFCSPINIGSPAFATLEILKDKKIPVYTKNSKEELATPTGVAIISTICSDFGDMPVMEVEKSGYGAGTKNLPGNLLCVLIGTTKERQAVKYDKDEVVSLETNIDDMDPRIYPYIMDKILKAGAKDVWFNQVLMKKGRPGIVFSVLCNQKDENKILELIFNETTTIGIRRNLVKRYVLKRENKSEEKISYLNNGKYKVKSEFKLAHKKALKAKIPLYKIMK